MMPLLSTYQLKGSCSNFLPVPSPWSRGSKVNQFLRAFYPLGRKDRSISLRCSPCSSLGTSLPHESRSKLLKITAFKGSSRLDDSGVRDNDSQSLSNPIKVSYLQHLSVDSSKVQNIVPTPYTVTDDAATRSIDIQDLLKKWVMLLRMPSQMLLRMPAQTQEINGDLGEPSSVETLETQNHQEKGERAIILKAVWRYFLCLDPAITIPLLILTLMYSTVNTMYGSAVSKELTPLWIIGPLIIALYTKIFLVICRLYVFSFKQTIKIVKNLPDYSLLVYEYVFCGKLKETMHIYMWQPFADIKNMDYKLLARRKMKGFQGWLFEWYLDFIESVWPYYSRTIRFLKRANLL